MATSDLDDLYQDVVMDHGASPRNMRRVPGAQRSAHGFNPFCGDLIDLEIRIDGGQIADIGFTGKGCAISRASTSLMTEAVMGRSTDEAGEIFGAFHHMITGGAPGPDPDPGTSGDPDDDRRSESLGDSEALSGVAAYPTRIKCAMLGWRALVAALGEEGERDSVSTE